MNNKSDKVIEISSILEVKQYLMGYAGIVFDLDDTLYGEKDYVRSGYNQVAIYLSKKIACADYLLEAERISELLWGFFEEKRNAIDEVLHHKNIYSDELKEKCLEIYRFHKPDIKLYPGVRDILLSLKNENRKLGIITDGRTEGQKAKIDTLNLAEFFDPIIITDALGGIEYRKPNPKAYKLIQDKWQIPFDQMVYVGDNIKKDFIAPKELGMAMIYFINPEGLYYEK